ncbi:MAG TPA: S41 family peptidase [Stellaceae bacterium]|nr:S41 family peptidase [Stellaceae bacterium]
MRGAVFFLLLVGLLAPATGFAQGTSTQDQFAAKAAAETSDKQTVYQELNLFGEAFDRIRRDAVDPVVDMKLVRSAIAGMLSGLDSHSAYIDEATWKAEKDVPGGVVDTTGLAVTLDHGLVRVVSPRDGSPAAKAGIKPGDVIFLIGKEPTDEMTLTQVEEAMRGPPGSEVVLTLRRSGVDKPLKLTLKRAAYQLKTVSDRVQAGDIGYIRIAGFDAGTPAAVGVAVQDLRQQTGSKLIGFILDLRNNPGGDFDAAVKTADAFLDKGDITVIKSRDSDQLKRIAATPGDLANGLPIVALVNGGTAEEAELVAGALQDNRRALLLGTKTFGESAIESVIPLHGEGAIRLTTARFLTPNANSIEGKGLTPDLTIEPMKIEKLAEGEQIREADLPGALKNPDLLKQEQQPQKAGKPSASGQEQPTTGKPAPAAPPGASATLAPAAPSVASADLGSGKDEQLTEATDVLRGLSLARARTAD